MLKNIKSSKIHELFILWLVIFTMILKKKTKKNTQTDVLQVCQHASLRNGDQVQLRFIITSTVINVVVIAIKHTVYLCKDNKPKLLEDKHNFQKYRMCIIVILSYCTALDYKAFPVFKGGLGLVNCERKHLTLVEIQNY